MVINDIDFDIVARNAIILLIALTVEVLELAVDCMIHIWYSAFINRVHAEILANVIHPLIVEVVRKIANKTKGTVLGKTWVYGSRSLRLALPQEKWTLLLSYLHTPYDLTYKQAQKTRCTITLAEERQDHRERRMFNQAPTHRACADRFREEGTVLPFGRERKEFVIPNPYILSTIAMLMSRLI